MASRKTFLQQSSVLLGAGMLASAFDNKAFSYFKGNRMPSDQINIGAIGINGMGWADIKAALTVPGVNIVALCDVDKNVVDRRMADLAKMNIDTARIKTYGNYKALLDQKDVDTVIIGTPDHWHALI